MARPAFNLALSDLAAIPASKLRILTDPPPFHVLRVLPLLLALHASPDLIHQSIFQIELKRFIFIIIKSNFAFLK